MSKYANMVTTEWADGVYTFALNVAEIEELQRICSISKDRHGNAIPEPFGRIFLRVTSADFYMKDMTETIRLGLCGGGLPPVRAKELMDTYVYGKPVARADDPASNYQIAVKILTAVMNGIEQDDRDHDVKQDEAKSIDVPSMRATLIQCGVPATEVDAMPLADWINMNKAVGKKDTGTKTPEDFKPIFEALKGINFAQLEKEQGVKLN